MAISVKLDTILAKNKMSIRELSRITGISQTDLKTLKKVQFIDHRFTMLEQICHALDCKITDILVSDSKEEE